MEASNVLSYIQVFLAAIVILAGVNLYLLYRLREIDPFEKWNANRINGVLFMVFLTVGMVAAYWSNNDWADLYAMIMHPASAHGVKIDGLMKVTLAVCVFVFVSVNGVLMYFAYKYRGRGQKATYYPHNSKLELIWTIIPAIGLSGLVFYGVGIWHEIFSKAPENSLRIELYGKQFDWTIRYAGADNKFGESHFTRIDDNIGNTAGMNLADANSHDDFYIMDTLVIPVNKPVNFRIAARDVLHSATILQFRMKMDAVPGMPTSFWLTPIHTTAEMRTIKKNPEFNYEMSCQQICGGGHWNMRRIVKVVTDAEYKAWFATQKSFYAKLQEQNAPAPTVTEDLKPATETTPKVATNKGTSQALVMN